MVVPNYIPDPLEVPGNVTLEPYLVRLGFVRRVSALHLASVGVVGAAAALWPRPQSLGLFALAVGFIVCLAALSLIRAMLRGSRFEVAASGAALLPTLIVAGLLVRKLTDSGFPAWSVAAGASVTTLYALLCGKDYSYVGQFVLSLLVSSLGIVGLEVFRGASWGDLSAALGLNLAFLFFLVYDSASLLSRRRLGEEIGAVADLYRDLLNWIGYVPRVVLHWRRHKIWELR